MTAVAVQQNGADQQQYNPRQSPQSPNMSSPHQSRPQSYTGATQQLAPLQNGNSALMNPRPAVSNDPVQVNGNGRRGSAARSTADSENTKRDNRASQGRPTSAPNAIPGSSPDDSEVERRTRRPKPLLQRAKSDFGPRGEELDSQEEDVQDWGARHGFEDHYASEEYVAQLANVSCAFLLHFSLCGHPHDAVSCCSSTNRSQGTAKSSP